MASSFAKRPDHGRTDGAGKILLSGVARLPVRHKIEDLQIHIRPAAAVTAVIVEELFVHPVEPLRRNRPSRPEVSR